MKKHYLTTNIWLKLASFVLAIALWFFVIISGRSGLVKDVPLMYVNLPRGFEVVDFPKTVSVNIEGQERILKNLKQNEINAFIDLSGMKAGKSFYALTHENIKMPGTLELIGIEPQTVNLTIEKLQKKTVSVQPAIAGVPEHGFVIVEIKVAPEKIEIEGPGNIISKIYSVKTEPIDINGLNGNLQYEAKINLTNSGVRVKEQKVEVNIFVKNIKK